MSGIFLDSNIVIYAFTPGDIRRDCAKALLTGGFRISVQVLNEFSNVARRKMKLSWPTITTAIEALCEMGTPPLPLTVATNQAALRLATRYGFAFYDCLIIASALEADCTILLTEDMQDGQLIEGRLTIQNPFLPS